MLVILKLQNLKKSFLSKFHNKFKYTIYFEKCYRKNRLVLLKVWVQIAYLVLLIKMFLFESMSVFQLCYISVFIRIFIATYL